MLTFLRKIRKSLIESGSASKYLLYAIGEILLVMIGILLALQVNNWNEGRKAKDFEREILRDINDGLEMNIWQLKSGIRSCNSAANSCDVVLQYLDDEINYHDSLQQHFSRAIRWFRPTVTNSGYESLKTYGRHLVRNDSIRHQLEIFDYEWIHVLHDRQEQFFNVTVSPLLTKYFTSLNLPLSRGGQMKPFNAVELKRSREYYNVISTLKINRESQVLWYNDWLEQMNKLSATIQEELGQFK